MLASGSLKVEIIRVSCIQSSFCIHSRCTTFTSSVLCVQFTHDFVQHKDETAYVLHCPYRNSQHRAQSMWDWKDTLILNTSHGLDFMLLAPSASMITEYCHIIFTAYSSAAFRIPLVSSSSV